jgi:hypothetical protein
MFATQLVSNSLAEFLTQASSRIPAHAKVWHQPIFELSEILKTGTFPHCKSVPAQSQIWHTMWQRCLKWRTISHMWSIFCFMCQTCLLHFFTHGVPNTHQVKSTEDYCEAYFTQHVSNVTLCRCQIYSARQFYFDFCKGRNISVLNFDLLNESSW